MVDCAIQVSYLFRNVRARHAHQCCNEASKIFEASKIIVRRFIFVFIFGQFSETEESLKLRRFFTEDSEDFPSKNSTFESQKLNFIVSLSRKETKTQVTFASEYPYFFHHRYDIFCSYIFFTLNYLCSSLIFANRPFHFKIFGTSKNFQSSKTFEDFCFPRRFFVFIFGLFSESEESSYSSSVYFQKPKNLRIRLRSIFNLCCNTVLD